MPKDAILMQSDRRNVLLLKKNVPEEMADFLVWRAKKKIKAKCLRAVVDFHDYLWNYKKRLNKITLDEIETELVCLGMTTYKEFYGIDFKKAMYMGYKNRTNNKRMQDMDVIHPDRLAQLVDSASAGLWELRKERFDHGFTIINHTLNIPDPAAVVEHNYWITHNLGLLCKLNSMYAHRDDFISMRGAHA